MIAEREDLKLAAIKIPQPGVLVSSNGHKGKASSLNGSTRASYTGGNSSAVSCGLERLINVAQQAKIKQLKRVQLLKTQTHQKAHLLTHNQKQETLEEARAQAAQKHMGELRAERLKHEASVEARRKEIVAQEKSHRQKRRDSLIKALGSLEEKAALLMRKRTADAEMAREQKLREIEQRKNAIIARSNELKETHNIRKQKKLAAAAVREDRIAKQKAKDGADNCSKKDKADAKTLKTLEAAEKEFEKRSGQFQAKVMKKEEALQVKEKLRAEARAIKKGEACRRHEKHQRCLQQKLERDVVEHRKAEKKVQKKAQKAEAFEGQRHALMKELEETRLEIAQHEAFLKGAAEKMSQEKKYEVTPEIEALEQKYALDLGMRGIVSPNVK